MPTKTAATVLDDIFAWSAKLSLWQRDALRRIVRDGQLNETDCKELAGLCRAEHGLPAPEGAATQPRPLAASDLPGSPNGVHAVSLVGISHAENVNALCGKQDLVFGPAGITIIFGYNGSGKSGYGRILKKACRARRKGEAIMPNVHVAPATGPASAEIRYALNGTEQAPEQWIDGTREIATLSAVSFFDADCGHAHVSDKNQIAFTPFGLDVLPNLGKGYLQVQALLEQEKKRETLFQPEFLRDQKTRAATKVGKLIRGLSANLDIVELERLAGLQDDEVKRMEQIRVELTNDPLKAAEGIRTRARRVAMLGAIIDQAMKLLDDAGLDQIKGLALDNAAKKQAAVLAAGKLFIDEPLPDVGGPVWRALWEAARAYSTDAAYPDKPFPATQDGARCVLCQQEIESEAAVRMQRFEDFVRDDTASKAADAQSALEGAIGAIGGLRLNESIVKELLEDLSNEGAGVCKEVRRCLAGLKWRRRWVATATRDGDWEQNRPSLASLGTAVADLTAALEKRATEIIAASSPGERAKLEAELAELEDRQWLGTVVGDVKTEIDRRKRLALLDRCIADTRTNAVTAKSKALAKEHVTDQLRRAFAEEVKAMQQGVTRLAIELTATSGEYGASLYRVQLVGAAKTPVDRVASEGEHRCIALAGFLAELATQQAKSAIVFDDPVTSLDHRWRHCFAKRLVEVSADRQVIVFTHDIVFLHDLMENARHADATLTLQRVASDRDRTGLVSDSLPWVAQSCKQQIDTLEKKARALRTLFAAGNDDEYFREAGILYDDLRAAVECVVEREVFAGVVHRFRDYVDFKRLKDAVVFSLADCDRIQKLFAKCCGITPAHSRALARGLGAPSPDEMLADIKELSDIIAEIKERQKKATKTGAVLAS